MMTNEVNIDYEDKNKDPSLRNHSNSGSFDKEKPHPRKSRMRTKRSSDDTEFEVLKVTTDLEIYYEK